MQRLTRIDQPAMAAWGEFSFLPDEDNVIEVPDEAVEALAAFGFIPAPMKPIAPKNLFPIVESAEAERVKRSYNKRN